VTESVPGPSTYGWSGSDSVAFPAKGVTVGGGHVSRGGESAVGQSAADGVPRNSSFTTQTGPVIGNSSSYYFHAMNLPASSKVAGLRTSWTFTPPVSGLAWTILDADYMASGGSTFEDIARVRATDASGARRPFAIANGANHQLAGELVEGDTDTATTSTAANATWTFNGSVSTLYAEYWQGDQPTTAATEQYTAFANPPGAPTTSVTRR
jgi:hypothetical protein